MKFSVIIPDRNDRREFTDHCFFQLERQTVKPDQIIHVNYKPVSKDIDLVDRIKSGIKQSRNDKIFIIENDDYYPDDYFEKMAFDCDFIGVGSTWYYNIKTLGYKFLTHNNQDRSGLFCTGFKKSALNGFVFPNNIWLDLALWQFAKNYKLLKEFEVVGIKHNTGLCGGRGHDDRIYKDHDTNMDWLKKRVRKESFEFYKQWHTNNK